MIMATQSSVLKEKYDEKKQQISLNCWYSRVKRSCYYHKLEFQVKRRKKLSSRTSLFNLNQEPKKNKNKIFAVSKKMRIKL